MISPPDISKKSWSIGVLQGRVVIAETQGGTPIAAFSPSDALVFAATVVRYALEIATKVVGEAIDSVYKDAGKG